MSSPALAQPLGKQQTKLRDRRQIELRPLLAGYKPLGDCSNQNLLLLFWSPPNFLLAQNISKSFTPSYLGTGASGFLSLALSGIQPDRLKDRAAGNMAVAGCGGQQGIVAHARSPLAAVAR